MSESTTSTPENTVKVKEKKAKELTINQVLPFPLPKSEMACSVCSKVLKDHFYLDFFLSPNHMNEVEKFLMQLRLKLDKALEAFNRLSKERDSRFWGIKAIVDTLIDTYKENPVLTNEIIQLSSHFDASEKTDYRNRAIGHSLFTNLTTKYNAFCEQFYLELNEYRRLNDGDLYRELTFGVSYNETEKTPELFIVEKALKENCPLYVAFVRLYEKQAELKYRKIRRWLFDCASFVNGFHDVIQISLKSDSPLMRAGAENERQFKDRKYVTSLISKVLKKNQGVGGNSAFE